MKKQLATITSLLFALLFSALQSTALASQVQITPPPEPDEVWLLINPEEQRLEVMLGEYPVVYYKNIAWGRGGIALKQRKGDEVTPVGNFKIRWINRNSKFRTFFGFDYPNPTYAEQGLRTGAITTAQHNRILNDWQQDKVPPQNTDIGGALGIHGLGKADLSIHESLNWTSGCIALNNAQIDHLAQLIDIGTRVVIAR